MKNSAARITQNRQIALFSLWSFNQSETGKIKKKGCRNICLMKRKMFFMIAKAESNLPTFHKFELERSFR